MSEPATASYVYCVVAAAQVPPLDELAGVDPASAVAAVRERELCALTSRVPLAQFGEQALRRNLEQLAWVERVARAHDAVLARALASGSVVPLRLCTLFADEAHVRAMLLRERGRLLDALRRLRGRVEWSVKLRADPRRLEAIAHERAGGGAAAGGGTAGGGATAGGESAQETPGRAFFARRQAERSLHEEAQALATAVAEEVHARLRAEASAATLLPPQDPALSGRAGAMVLNGAYLVERARTASFSAAVSELAARHRASGVEIDVSGPWAPYNFVATEDERDERRATAPGHPA